MLFVERENKKLDMHFSNQRIYLMNFIFIDNELKNPEQNDYHELIIFFFLQI